MAIQIKKVQVTNPQTKELGFTYRQVNIGKAKDKQVAELVEQQGALTKGDARSAMAELPRIIAQALSNNMKVELEDFGCFQVTLSSGMQANAEDLRKTDVKVGISFTPSDEMLQIVQSADLTVKKVSTTDDTDDTTDTTTDDADTDTTGGTTENPNEGA